MSARLTGILGRAGVNAYLTTTESGHENWLTILGGVDERVFAPGDEVTYEAAHDALGPAYATNVQQVYP